MNLGSSICEASEINNSVPFTLQDNLNGTETVITQAEAWKMARRRVSRWANQAHDPYGQQLDCPVTQPAFLSQEHSPASTNGPTTRTVRQDRSSFGVEVTQSDAGVAAEVTFGGTTVD